MVYLVISVAFWVMEMMVHEVWMWRRHGGRFEWFRSGRNGAIWSARKEGGVAGGPGRFEMCEVFFSTEAKWLGNLGKLEKHLGHLIWTVPWLTFLHSIVTKDGLVCSLTGLNLKGCNSRMSKLFQWCHDDEIYDVFPLHFLRGQTTKNQRWYSWK